MTSFHRGLLALSGPAALLLLGAGSAQAHHFMDIRTLPVSPLNGLLSGLAHPVIGPDHLLFLLALSLVGLRARGPWMLGLLAVGLMGSALGLVLPGLPGADLIAALTLAVEALVVLGRLPVAVLLPAMALHGYVLSGAVMGWSAMPVGAYLVGLMLSQGALLLVALLGLQRLTQALQPIARRSLAGLLIGLSAAASLAALAA
jgi:urease accessory protein